MHNLSISEAKDSLHSAYSTLFNLGATREELDVVMRTLGILTRYEHKAPPIQERDEPFGSSGWHAHSMLPSTF